MRTAEEILKENASDVDYWTSGFKADIKDAMKQYAKEALGEAADQLNNFIIGQQLKNDIRTEIISLMNELK